MLAAVVEKSKASWRAWPRGDRLLGYEILDRIGLGGMAEVYRARKSGAAGFEKIVVLKRLLPNLAADPVAQEMFIDEARIGARLQQRNVVQTFGLEQSAGGDLLMVMEYVEGVDLRRVMRAAEKAALRIPLWFSLHLASEVLSALSYAHQLSGADGRPLGLIHRDVTPPNVYLSWSGDVKVGDFGVARTEASRRHTATGAIKGKLEYTSPEQLQGKKSDHRVDLFSVGVMLWELLAQRSLFTGGSDYSVMERICAPERPAPSRHNREVSAALDSCVLRALHVSPAERHDSADALQRELLAILSQVRSVVQPCDVRALLASLLEREDPTLALSPPPGSASASASASASSSASAAASAAV
jgi:serine/threonine protein kinase